MNIISLFIKGIFIFTLFLSPFSAFAKNTNTKKQTPQFTNKSFDKVFVKLENQIKEATNKLEGIEKNIDKLPDKLVGIEKTIGDFSNYIGKEIIKTNNEIGIFTSKTENILEKMSGNNDKWVSWTLTMLLFMAAVLQAKISNCIMKPKLCIKKEVKYRDFDPGGYPYKACRILIENNGRSAAQNCKAYIVVKNSKERVCWMVPTERPKATINKDDIEELDFCAFLRGERVFFPEHLGGNPPTLLPEAIFPNESKWPDPAKAIEFEYGLLTNIVECKVLITASNAKSVSMKVKIDYQNKQIKLS